MRISIKHKQLQEKSRWSNARNIKMLESSDTNLMEVPRKFQPKGSSSSQTTKMPDFTREIRCSKSNKRKAKLDDGEKAEGESPGNADGALVLVPIEWRVRVRKFRRGGWRGGRRQEREITLVTV